MPIRKENRALYPPDWPAISARIRHERAGDRCECDGRCGARQHQAGRCEAVNGQPSPYTGSVVVLTVAHLNHDPSDTRDEALMAACQKCHLSYDRDQHAETRRRTAAAARAVRARDEQLVKAGQYPGQETLF